MMPDRDNYPDPREEDIMAGDRRLSRPDASLPDWEVSDTAYRPIPIVWFTGALILQMMTLTIIAILFSGIGGLVMIVLGVFASGAIYVWTWDRGMKSASATWRVSTLVMILAQLLFLCVTAFPRL